MKYDKILPDVLQRDLLSDTTVIILAAGAGSRMRSRTPKVLHKVAGRYLLEYLLITSKSLDIADIRVVLNKNVAEAPEIAKLSSEYNFSIVVQDKQLGTGDAVKSAIKESMPGKFILVMYGDAPFLKHETALRLLSKLSYCDVSLLVFEAKDPTGYGRVIKKLGDSNIKSGTEFDIESIIEDRDATPEQKRILLCNGGTISFTRETALDFIKTHRPRENVEHYITDIASFISSRGGRVCGVLLNKNEVLGVNDKSQLANAEALIQDALREFWMRQGVTMIDPKSVFLSHDTTLAKDVVIYPNVFIGPCVSIGQGSTIFPYSHIEGAQIGHECSIGPFARVRPSTKLGAKVKIGNFVEVKNSEMENDVKAMHLSYVGDASIGETSNIGAGVIFCNYNGKTKSRCKVGKKSFIGSNSSIIAPRDIGDNVTIGAGSVIAQDVPSNSLATSRSPQKNLNKTAKNTAKL